MEHHNKHQLALLHDERTSVDDALVLLQGIHEATLMAENVGNLPKNVLYKTFLETMHIPALSSFTENWLDNVSGPDERVSNHRFGMACQLVIGTMLAVKADVHDSEGPKVLITKMLEHIKEHHAFIHDEERAKEAMLTKRQKFIYKTIGPMGHKVYKDVDSFLKDDKDIKIMGIPGDGEDPVEINLEEEEHGNA